MFYLYLIPGILFAITLHEFAHGFVSWKLGDLTAKNAGRLTLNPLSHLDPLGAVCMLLFHMGWAKPVPINPWYYKNKKLGIILTSLAGPLMNILTGGISIFVMVWMEMAVRGGILAAGNAVNTIYTILYYFSVLSINLAVFNLIPIPPLDGSKILIPFLSSKAQEWFYRYERYFMIALMVCLYAGVLDAPINAFYTLIEEGIWRLAIMAFSGMSAGFI
ncbi:MAG: site-2 protease family protein [Lachnospiraceae bacterium]